MACMTPPITPYCYRGTILRWVDGDTLDIEVDLGFKVKTLQRFRLIGVNTPERGEPGFKEAKALAERLAPIGSSLLFESMKSDKYGRWLIHIAPVSDALLANGLAASSPSSWG
jgi:micrococcal nuclease